MKHGGRRAADDALVGHLAGGMTVRDAAAAARVGETTAYRRLRDPRFRARLDELRGAATAAALNKLCDTMSAAAATLAALLTSASEDTRHRAAVKVIELAVRLRDQDELARRVAELEAKQAGTDGNPRR